MNQKLDNNDDDDSNINKCEAHELNHFHLRIRLFLLKNISLQQYNENQLLNEIIIHIIKVYYYYLFFLLISTYILVIHVIL